MPLVRITLAPGRSAEDRRAIADGVHEALVEAASVPPDDRFQIIEETSPDGLVITPSYLGLAHTPAAVIVQVFLNAGRTVPVKEALFKAIADHLAARPGVRREDVIVNLVEVARECWSFGGGVMSYPPAK